MGAERRSKKSRWGIISGYALSELSNAASASYFLDERRGAESLEKGEKLNLGARRLESCALAGMESFQTVITGFDINVGFNRRDLRYEVRRGEDDYVIDAGECPESKRALSLTLHGACRTFQNTRTGIGIQRDDEMIAEFTGLLKKIDMPGMQQIEAAVGHHQPAARSAQTFAHLDHRSQIDQLGILQGHLKIECMVQLLVFGNTPKERTASSTWRTVIASRHGGLYRAEGVQSLK